MEQLEKENIAQTLARELPKPGLLFVQEAEGERGGITHLAIPKTMQHIAIDDEATQLHPRRIKAVADFGDIESFVHYVERNKAGNSIVWANFNPTTFALAFTAVFDEHDHYIDPTTKAVVPAAERPGWRGHRATLTPLLSSEWGTWLSNNGSGRAKTQVGFAEFIEDHADDISAGEGLPSSLDMLNMALQFEAKQDMRIKSHVRLQSGGVDLTYVNKDDDGTLEKMRLFERFEIGIPVFRGGTAFAIGAKLRYRVKEGTVAFWYELRRPDKVHEAAALKIIKQIRDAIGSTPLLLGGIPI